MVSTFLTQLVMLLVLLPSTPGDKQQSADARRSTRSPHGTLNTPCENCHTFTSWKPIRQVPEFNHDKTGYPLRGMHASVSCRGCHTKLVFTDVGKKCADCHADIHKQQFGAQCDSCHTVRGWKVSIQSINEHQNRFPLIGAHAAVDCISCHKGAATGQYRGLSTDCAWCHGAQFRATKSPDHVALSFPTTCTNCHSFDGWSGAKFDHARFTGFVLSGAHAKLDCMSCHAGGRFQGTSATCFSCHEKDYNAAKNPDHVGAGLPRECGTCHTMNSWGGARFDHNSFTSFPLTGAHTSVQCSQCHVNGQFKGTPTACASCHLAAYQKTTNPNHSAAGFPTTCQTCHTTVTWSGAKFDHSTTGFPLTGAHTSVQCSQCHVNNKYAGTSKDCVSCHLPDFQKTTNPNHLAAGFPTTCQTCHTTVQWSGAKFDHSTTGFALTGAHVNTACSSCHVNGKFPGTPTDCASCHLADFQKTTSPNHGAAGFSQNCQTCHTTVTWAGAVFDHAKTQFPLTGLHTTVACASCHVNNRYAGTPTTCVSCHLTDYQKTTNPNHAATGLPTECQVCHSTAGWVPATFNHNNTQFPLTGAHTSVQCTQCHVNGRYSGTPTDCASCHLAEFQKTTNPNHAAAGFPTTCQTCHTTGAWSGAKFDHATTGFALTGAHVNTPCASCHVNNRYAGTPSDCVGCHLPDFQKTTNPNHVAAGFPTTCQTCHTTVQWAGAKFDHSTTGFVLTGAHVNTSCASCHVNGRFAGTPTDCMSCHVADYQGTTNPNHVAAMFPTTCQTCHTTVQWAGAKFDHNTYTKFALTGAHINTPCASCHVGGKYAGTPTTCAGCHLNQYQSTTNPNHVAAGFPTDCSICHTTVQWPGAKFDHTTTGFPLTGAHTGLNCNSCHSSGVYAGLGTACSTCHLNDYNNALTPNHKAAAFPLDCTICHTTSVWKPSTFNHSNTAFPLTGAHTTTPCASCHIAGRYAGTPTDCYSCHKSDYTGVSSPNHVAAAFPTTCQTCHTTIRWSGATFNHTWFPIYSGAHAGKWTSCADCHTNSSDYAVFTCLSCHAHDKSIMDPKHSGVRNYVYSSANCYSCHPTGKH